MPPAHSRTSCTNTPDTTTSPWNQAGAPPAGAERYGPTPPPEQRQRQQGHAPRPRGPTTPTRSPPPARRRPGSENNLSCQGDAVQRASQTFGASGGSAPSATTNPSCSDEG